MLEKHVGQQHNAITQKNNIWKTHRKHTSENNIRKTQKTHITIDKNIWKHIWKTIGNTHGKTRYEKHIDNTHMTQTQENTYSELRIQWSL